MMTIKRYYDSRVWLRVRSVRLRYDEYMCQECKRYGRTTPAAMVHHIYPIETHWELRSMLWNLLSLCNKCHERMHNRTSDEVTEIGIRWQEKIKNEIKVGSPL